MTEKIEIFGYNITTDPNFMDKENYMTDELSREMEALHEIALKGKQSGIKKFHRLIAKHPKNPQLKNYLSVLYNSMGNIEKAREVNNWIVKEHPNYLFAKLNVAHEHYINEEFEKIPEILGKGIELKTLYPERDTFHIAEVVSILQIAVFYYGGIGDFDQAEIRLNMLEELAPDYPSYYEEAAHELMMHRMEGEEKRFEEEYKNRITPVITPQKKTTLITSPSFKHTIIKDLYAFGLDIDKAILTTIVELPREEVVADLEKVLEDSIKRFSYFTEQEWEEENTQFVLHSVFLLTELEAYDSLDAILKTLQQSEEYMEWFYEDSLTELMWEPLLKMGKNQLDKLFDFMLLPGVYTSSKIQILEAIKQLVFHFPQMHDEAVELYNKSLQFYNTADLKNNVIDSDVIGFIVSGLLDIKETSLIPLIAELYEKGRVSLGICGSLEDVKHSFIEEYRLHEKEELMPMIERYEETLATWHGYNDDPIEMPLSYYQDGIDSLLGEESIGTSYKREEKKVGRNEPCPCGSGKKYKKCCLNKNS